MTHTHIDLAICRNTPQCCGTMKHDKLNGGRRGHSKYAQFYREVCVLQGKGFTWLEIAAEIQKKTDIKIDQSGLFRMWKHRQTGAVLIGTIPPEFTSDEGGGQQSAGSEVVDETALMKQLGLDTISNQTEKRTGTLKKRTSNL